MKNLFIVLVHLLLFNCIDAQTEYPLSERQIKFINEFNHFPKFEDFTKVPVQLMDAQNLLIPTLKEGKIIITSSTKREVSSSFNNHVDSLTLFFKDSLLVAMASNKSWTSGKRTLDYNEDRTLKSYGKSDIQYYENGSPKFYQWGSRSKEYIHHDSCITEVFYGRREQVMTKKTYCYNSDGFVVQDSSWHGVAKDSIPIMLGYTVSNFTYDHNRLVFQTSAHYKNKRAFAKDIPLDGEDKALMEKFMKIDTSFFGYNEYKFNKHGLLTDMIRNGTTLNHQNLDKEEFKSHIQFSYEFEPTNDGDVILKILATNDSKLSGAIQMTFNKDGFLTKLSYDGYSGFDISGNKFSRVQELFYEIPTK